MVWEVGGERLCEWLEACLALARGDAGGGGSASAAGAGLLGALARHVPLRCALPREAKAGARERKARRRWHVLLSEAVARASHEDAVARLLVALTVETLRQSADFEEDWFGLHLAACARLAPRMVSGAGLALLGSLVAELGTARAAAAAAGADASAPADTQASLSRLVLGLAKALRALVAGSGAGAGGSLGDGALRSVLCSLLQLVLANPGAARGAVSTIEQACLAVLLRPSVWGGGAEEPGSVGAAAARLLAATPACFGSASGHAWGALVHALLHSLLGLLSEGAVPASAGSAREQQAAARSRALAGRALAALGPQADGGDYYGATARAGEAAVAARQALADEELVALGGPTAAFSALAACLVAALRPAGQPRQAYLELRVAPVAALAEAALPLATTGYAGTGAPAGATGQGAAAAGAVVAAAALRVLAAVVPVAGPQLLRFRSALVAPLERLLLLPPRAAPPALREPLLLCCRAWLAAYGAAAAPQLAAAALRAAAASVRHVEQWPGADLDEGRLQRMAKDVAASGGSTPATAAAAASAAATVVAAPASALAGKSNKSKGASQASAFEQVDEAQLGAARLALALATAVLNGGAASAFSAVSAARIELDACLARALADTAGGAIAQLSDGTAALHAGYRTALLAALEASILAPVEHGTATSAVLPLALRVFSAVSREGSDPQAAAVAARALQACIALLHPAAPVLGAPRAVRHQQPGAAHEHEHEVEPQRPRKQQRLSEQQPNHQHQQDVESDAKEGHDDAVLAASSSSSAVATMTATIGAVQTQGRKSAPATTASLAAAALAVAHARLAEDSSAKCPSAPVEPASSSEANDEPQHGPPVVTANPHDEANKAKAKTALAPTKSSNVAAKPAARLPEQSKATSTAAFKRPTRRDDSDSDDLPSIVDSDE
jgi:hypothetical protein